MNSYAGTVISLLLTAGVMMAVTAVRGAEATREPRARTEKGWLASSKLGAWANQPASPKGVRLPLALGTATFLVGAFLSFVVFW